MEIFVVSNINSYPCEGDVFGVHNSLVTAKRQIDLLLEDEDYGSVEQDYVVRKYILNACDTSDYLSKNEVVYKKLGEATIDRLKRNVEKDGKDNWSAQELMKWVEQ